MQNKNKFSWINNKLRIENSSVDGVGLIAQSKIFKDEILIVQGGRCLHIDEIDDAELDEYSYLGFQVEEQVYIFPVFENGAPIPDGIFKVNHSCEPNAGFKGQITLVAMCDIKAGAEITFDYAMTDVQFDGDKTWDTMYCHCNKKLCRKEITGHDWKLPELQKRYAGYFSKHVADAIEKHKLKN